MKPLFILLAGLFILHTIANSQPISMTVDGSTQGRFKSDNGAKEDKMSVIGVTLEAGAANANGAISGRRQYQPLIVKKTAGAASPQFLQAMINNEMLKKVIIEFKGPNPNGEEVVTYTITLESVRVVNFKQAADIPDGGKAPRNLLIDEIKLVFQKITVESNTAHTMAADDTGGAR